MSSYAAMDRHFPTTLTARLGPVNAEAVVVGEGGDVGDVSMGRYSTIITPVHGIVVKTKASDTVEGLGAKYQVDPQVIIDFNRLRSTQLTPGMTLVLPGGVGGAFPPPPAIYQILHGGSPSNYMVHVVGCCLGP